MTSNADAVCPECGATEPDWNGARADPDSLRADNERLRAALERGTYYINRLEAAQRGHVVRDLDEASNAWESYQARCALEQKI